MQAVIESGILSITYHRCIGLVRIQYAFVLPETLQKSTFAMPWCNDGGAAEINDVMLLRHDAHVHVPPMGASNPV
jgi:hypothetical protein